MNWYKIYKKKTIYFPTNSDSALDGQSINKNKTSI